MRLRSIRRNPQLIRENWHQPWLKRLLAYSLTLFFLAFGDAILTYFSPVYIEGMVHNELLMGMIISTSSMVGFACDILFGEWFSNKPHHFFMKAALITYLLFALSFILLPQHPIFILVSMALWGVGFELILFSDFHFIDESLAHPQHAIGWSTIKTFTGIAYMLGPLLASFLYERAVKIAPIGALVLIILSGLWFMWLSKSMNRKREVTEKSEKKHSIIHEFRVWHLLLPKLWPVFLFVFMVTIVDATFWTIGSVWSENLKGLHPFGGFLVTVYMLPSLFAYFIGSWLGRFLGKKRTAFLGGILAGLSFVFIGFINNIIILLCLVFVASFFLSLATPEIYGAVEDYIERLGHNANALVGLENSVTSLSFIIGPIFAGAIAKYFGDQITFTVIGAMLFGISMLAILIVPKKIHLPKQALEKIS